MRSETQIKQGKRKAYVERVKNTNYLYHKRAEHNTPHVTKRVGTC